MRALILGVGDAFTARSFGSSAVIEAPAGYVLLDCPDLIHRALREAREKSGWAVDRTKITDILLTHLHGDHCNGLESLGFARRDLHPDLPRPRLHTWPKVGDRVWERLAPAMDAGGERTLDDYYDLRTFEADETTEHKVAGLTVRARPTRHPIPTIGFLISDGRRTLGWSSDTPFEQAHIDFLSRADLIVHESNVGPPHTPIEDLNALPAELRAKMRLIHLPDDFDRSRTDIGMLEPGQVLEV